MQSRARHRPAALARWLAVAVAAQLAAPPVPVIAQAAAGSPPPPEYGRALTAIMSDDEREAWEALDAADAQSAFIEAFWERRDPTPGTEDNELRAIFERRMQRAARLFGEGDRDGPATDRGRVLLVLGLPDEQEMRPAADGESELTWTYRGGARPGALRFAAVDSGFALETDLELTEEAFLQSVEDELRTTIGARLGGGRALLERPAAGSAGGDGTPDPEEVRSALAELAPEVRIWLQLVFGDVARDDIGLRHRIDFFPATEGTYTVLSFKVDPKDVSFAPPADDGDDETTGTESDSASGQNAAAGDAEDAEDAEPTLRARLKVFGAVLEGARGQESTVHQFILPYEPARPSDSGPELATQTLSVTLYPGTYRLAWGLLDEETGLAATRDETLVVPDFEGPGLRLTRPLIARPPHREDSGPIDTGKLYPGVRLGRVLIADDLARTFARDDVIEIVAVATGWASDPAAPGKPRLEVIYSILAGVEGDRSLASIPPQVLDFSVLGQQIPLAQVARLRPGESYRVRVLVRDLVSGVETVQHALLHLAAEESPE